MTALPTVAFPILLAMLLPAQVDPVQGMKGLPGLKGMPGQPLWLLTQLPIWLVIIYGARQQRQACAARQKMLSEEEESKTPYSDEDLMENCEFKIIRNELNLFEQPQLLEEALREEGRAGWQLVEKFDGNRLRLKRAASQREGDAALPADYDPYRTVVLSEATKIAQTHKRHKDMRIAGWVIAVCVGIAVVLGVAAAAVRSDLGGLRFALGFAAVCAGVVALIALIGGVIVRSFTK